MAISARRGRASVLLREGFFPRAVARGASMLACVALLAGCATVEPAAGLSAAERVAIRSALRDEHWQVVSSRFPDASRPPVRVTKTMDGGNWEAAMIGCLRSEGFTVFVDGRYFQFGHTSGRSAQDYALVTYRCISRFPIADDVLQFLDGPRLDALYRYYVGTVRPCLLVSGVPSEAPPTQFAFILGAHAGTGWSPYSEIWGSSMPSARLSFLEQLCPPLPGWLDLAE